VEKDEDAAENDEELRDITDRATLAEEEKRQLQAQVNKDCVVLERALADKFLPNFIPYACMPFLLEYHPVRDIFIT
jgi:hypothetical protein